MPDRAFPIVFASKVTATAAFYEQLGFQQHIQLPPDGEPGYIGLRRGTFEIAVVSADWPAQQYSATLGTGVRFEMYVYVDDVDGQIDSLRSQGTQVLREPTTMPWGERLAYIADPDGNPVGLASAPGRPSGREQQSRAMPAGTEKTQREQRDATPVAPPVPTAVVDMVNAAGRNGVATELERGLVAHGITEGR